MNHDAMNCKQCSGALELCEVRGHLETWRCPACGWETWSTVSKVDPPRRPGPDRAHVFVTWQGGQPSLREVQHVRALLPSLQHRGILELRAEWASTQELDLGELAIDEATRVLEKAREFGLLARAIPPVSQKSGA